jgi:major intracellular serine protease
MFKLINHTLNQVVTSVDEDVEIPYGVSLIGGPTMWERGFDGTGKTVAIIDTGAETTHDAIFGRVRHFKNFTNEGPESSVQDLHGHGTHVAGIVAAAGGAIRGISPGVKLIILKALNGQGQGTNYAITDAINYAVNWRSPDGTEKVDVISMSLGGPQDYEPMHEAIKRAVANDILVVCASGNDGDGNADTSEVSYPGAYPEVVEVGAIDAALGLARFSNTNSEIDLVAPGVNVKSAYLNNTYAVMSGTSMATPYVAGAAAIVKQHIESVLGRKITEPELYEYLSVRTRSLGLSKEAQGKGVVDLLANYGYVRRNPEDIPLSEALAGLARLGIIDSPDFWQNLADKYAADPDKYYDFRFVDLLIKKFYSSK